MEPFVSRFSNDYALGGKAIKLIGSAVRVAGANAFATLFLTIIAVITARTLGPSGRGAIVLITTTATYVMLICSLGIPIPARVMMGGRDSHAVIRYYLGLGVVLSVVQIGVSIALIQLVLSRSGVAVTIQDELLAGLYSGLLMAAYLLVHCVYGVGLNQLAALLQVFGALFQLIGVASLAALGSNSAWRYVSALSVGMIGQVLASLVVLSRNDFSVRPAVDIPAWLHLIRSGLTAIGLTLGQAAVLRIDRILVGLYLAASAVGIYSVAATATEIVWLLPLALSQVLFHGLASRSVDLATATKAKVASLAVALLCAISMYAVAPIAIDKIVGTQFHDAVTPLRILLVGAVLLSSYQLDAYILAGRGKFGLAAGATAGGFCAMFILDLVAIPAFGIVGAAWASVVAYGLMAMAVGILVARIHPQPELAPQNSST